MFPQQRAVYSYICGYLRGSNLSVLEAGCGDGQGTAMLERASKGILGTDKLEENVKYASEMYPWIRFSTWDINRPYAVRAGAVIAVEVVEHVANPRQAIQNLIDCSLRCVIISTPNGHGKPRPPENPYHVCEYTQGEMLSMIDSKYPVRVVDEFGGPLLYIIGTV